MKDEEKRIIIIFEKVIKESQLSFSELAEALYIAYSNGKNIEVKLRENDNKS